MGVMVCTSLSPTSISPHTQFLTFSVSQFQFLSVSQLSVKFDSDMHSGGVGVMCVWRGGSLGASPFTREEESGTLRIMDLFFTPHGYLGV